MCSFHKFVFNWATRSINAFHVIEINCILVMITCSSDFNLMNKWAHLCSLLHNESWCFRVFKWVANVHIIWSERCDAFTYYWVTFISWFIEFSIKLRRKSIKLNHICWAADIVSSWLNWLRQVEYLSLSWVLDSKSVELNWNFFEKVLSWIEKLNLRTWIELKSLTRQLDSTTRLDSTRY